MTTGMAWFPMTPTQAQAVQAAYAQEHHLPLTLSLDLGQGVRLDLVLIPSGEFIMGLPPDAFERYTAWEPHHDVLHDNPLLPHRVHIGTPFYLGRTAVTQAQWQAVMGSNPARFTGSDDLPVESVSAQEADGYCHALSAITSRQVRLPSEAEWEYACRAGSATLFCFGDSLDELDRFGWYRGNSGRRSQPVGLKRPNAWGLYDMHGGIDEFCQDPWHPSYNGAPTDGHAWIEGGDGAERVKRGGSWYDFGKYCCSPHRSSYPADTGCEDHGLRVVVAVPQAGQRL